MNKSIRLVLFGLLAFVLTACQDQVQQVAGSYSYKISGQALVRRTLSNDTVTLSNEEGAMDLIRIDSTAAMMTFNVLRGPVYKTQAQIHGKQITLDPYKRNITLGSTTYTVTASGTGEFYDNTLIVSLQYQSNDISTDEITLVCKKN